LSGFESNGDQVGMGAALLALAAVELYSGEARAAREMYARAAQRLGPWRRMVGWLRLMVAELSHELGDTRRAAREVDGAESAFRLVSCAMAAQRSAALRRALGSR
jgi:hypothetical protein